MFENLRPINKNAITDMRGLIDPSNLAQFNLYEGGYAIFAVLDIPYFVKLLCHDNPQHFSLVFGGVGFPGSYAYSPRVDLCQSAHNADSYGTRL